MEQTIGELGSIDILVNNAAIIRRAPAAERSLGDWDHMVSVNLNAAFRLCQLAGRHMLGNGGGKMLANERPAHNINVNAIAPGYMATDNTLPLREDPERNRQIMERIAAGRWGKPGDLAGAVVFLASPASEYMHGHILVIDGGWLAPRTQDSR